MRIKIGARRSDLARLQAYRVGKALESAHGGLTVEYFFKESLGDKNLHDPLWKMPERGVFTEDFLADLREEKVDLVVHSWKDLPVEDRPFTKIIASMARADARDLLLLRRDRLPQLQAKPASLRILSSSPRRAFNLEPFFKEYLPFVVENINFISVRGNIPTRVKKLFSEDADGLILAKAALDRLLAAEEPEFAAVQSELRFALKQSLFMVLPLEPNPPAAAQGALAIEALRTRDDLIALCAPLHCQNTFAAAEAERMVLRSYGGGCHQKIGIIQRNFPFGELLLAKGETQAGERFFLKRFTPSAGDIKKVPPQNLWPENPEFSFFERQALSTIHNPGSPLWISKSDALPETWKIPFDQIVWTSGLTTWKKLAARGVWVNGSEESLGEAVPKLATLLGETPHFLKLSHQDGSPSPEMTLLPTYKLVAKEIKPDWDTKTHFFWTSASNFLEALRLDPSIIDRHHACGPGNTHRILREKVKHLQVFLSYKEWQNSLCKT